MTRGVLDDLWKKEQRRPQEARLPAEIRGVAFYPEIAGDVAPSSSMLGDRSARVRPPTDPVEEDVDQLIGERLALRHVAEAQPLTGNSP